MKKAFSLGIVTVFISLLFLCSALLADDKEIPITTSSKEALKLFMEGRDKWEFAESDAAAKLFDQAIEKDQNFAQAYLFRAFTIGGYNVMRENIEKAEQLMDKVSEGEKHLILFLKAYSEGDGAKTKEHLEHMLKLYPADKHLLFLGGYYLLDYEDDYAKSIQYFEKALAIDNTYAPAYSNIGYAQRALKNYEAAEKAYKKLIELHPNRAVPYDSYGYLLMVIGKYDESIQQFKKAYDTDSSYISALAGISDNYVFKGDYEKAREYLEKWYDLSPNINGKFGALFWKAVTYVYEGKYEEALKVYDEYQMLAEENKIVPTVIYALRLKGLVNTESGNPKKGLEFYEKAGELVLNSDLPERLQEMHIYYAEVGKMYALSAMKDFEAAAAEAEKCKKMLENIKNLDDVQNFHTMLGYHEIMKGDYDKALEYLGKGDPDYQPTMYYMAVAYEKKGDKEKAMEWYKKLLDNNINSLNLAFYLPRVKEKLKE
jgi:tetratricopeptide (TPR) repeat protein